MHTFIHIEILLLPQYLFTFLSDAPLADALLCVCYLPDESPDLLPDHPGERLDQDHPVPGGVALHRHHRGLLPRRLLHVPSHQTLSQNWVRGYLLSRDIQF